MCLRSWNYRLPLIVWNIETFIPQTILGQILKGNRRITADTVIRLSKYFGTSAKFWLGLKDDYDLEEEKNLKKLEYDRIHPTKSDAAWGLSNVCLNVFFYNFDFNRSKYW